MAKYETFFIRLMLTEELGFQPPETNRALFNNSLTMLLSFCVFGTLPLVIYMIGMSNVSYTSHQLLVGSSLIGTCTLFILGMIKSRYSILSWYYSGFETSFLGICCAAIAYLIGYYVNSVLKSE